MQREIITKKNHQMLRVQDNEEKLAVVERKKALIG